MLINVDAKKHRSENEARGNRKTNDERTTKEPAKVPKDVPREWYAKKFFCSKGVCRTPTPGRGKMLVNVSILRTLKS